MRQELAVSLMAHDAVQDFRSSGRSDGSFRGHTVLTTGAAASFSRPPRITASSLQVRNSCITRARASSEAVMVPLLLGVLAVERAGSPDRVKAGINHRETREVEGGPLC